MVPVLADDEYILRFTARAAELLDVEALAFLGQDRFQIPVDWLPEDRGDWPSPKYLERFYDDLSITLAD